MGSRKVRISGVQAGICKSTLSWCNFLAFEVLAGCVAARHTETLENSPMRLDSNPIFRKMITPWYDSNTACWILITVLMGLAIFSWTGIRVALAHGDYQAYAWVPGMLLALCLLVAVSVVYRMIRRLYDRQVQKRNP